MSESINIPEPRCSFCGKTKKEVANFVEGQDNIMICEVCIEGSLKIVKEAKEKDEKSSDFSDMTPRELYSRLDEYVIGQDDAKKILSTEVREHYKRIEAPKTNYVELEKANTLMIGPTGCGKTLLLKTLSRILGVPFAAGDATTFTQAGYVGNDVESVLISLLVNANGDIRRAEKGIIFIDEIDKVSRKGENPGLTRDVSGEGVQQALLKMVEGSSCLIPADMSMRKHPSANTIEFDTTNVLFVFGGSFDGLMPIIKKRVSQGTTLGFTGDIKDKMENESVNDYFPLVETDDLIKFGLIPELIGRLPIIVTLGELSKDELRRILVEPKNSLIKQMQYSFDLDNVSLKFTDSAINLIVDRAIKKKMGARGLKSIVKNLMMETQFTLPESVKKNGLKEIDVDKDFVVKKFKEIDKTSKKCA